MALQVIGAGLGRTGTLTLKTALEMLGFAPCHHMVEVFAHPEQRHFWLRAARGEAVEWEEMFGGYNASVDWPSAHFYAALADRYPEAKVILTRRDPQRWFESISETILKAMSMHEGPAPDDHFMRFGDIIIAENTFGRDFGAANVIAAFERHNAEVQRIIPPERLLVFEAAQGWDPLCRFLGVGVPDTPFPRTNSREEFWQHTLPPELTAPVIPAAG
ncbi:MAG: sulfotransferase family protein [Sphingomonas sp.]|uniref:sulfotransferase family protein n=1 Tax=Sphingomonas sp. TaxID=28214 RepID=UPI003F815938